MSQQTINGANEKIDAAKWGYFPTPSVEVSARDEERYNTTVRIEQPIWTGGKLTSRHNIEISKGEEALYSLEENSYKLMENFFNVLENYAQATSQIKEFQDGLDTLYSLDEMLDRRMEAGVSSSSDKDLLKSRIDQINSDLILAKNRYKISIMQLELMLDRKVECNINLNKITVLHNNLIENSLERMKEFHPSLKKADKEIQTSEYELDNTKASIMPNLNLRLEHKNGDLYNENYDKSNNQNIVYLAFSATTNAGLSALSEINAAKIKVLELKFSKQSKEKELIDSLLNDYNNYEIAKNRIRVLINTVDSANKVLDSYQRLFLAGKKQWLDLVNSSRELMNYKIELQKQIVTKDILAYKLALKNGQIDLLSGEIR
jgi:adhesin transport system outer membrane protein